MCRRLTKLVQSLTKMVGGDWKVSIVVTGNTRAIITRSEVM
jgi:hypothetical protein